MRARPPRRRRRNRRPSGGLGRRPPAGPLPPALARARAGRPQKRCWSRRRHTTIQQCPATQNAGPAENQHTRPGSCVQPNPRPEPGPEAPVTGLPSQMAGDAAINECPTPPATPQPADSPAPSASLDATERLVSDYAARRGLPVGAVAARHACPACRTSGDRHYSTHIVTPPIPARCAWSARFLTMYVSAASSSRPCLHGTLTPPERGTQAYFHPCLPPATGHGRAAGCRTVTGPGRSLRSLWMNLGGKNRPETVSTTATGGRAASLALAANVNPLSTGSNPAIGAACYASFALSARRHSGRTALASGVAAYVCPVSGCRCSCGHAVPGVSA